MNSDVQQSDAFGDQQWLSIVELLDEGVILSGHDDVCSYANRGAEILLNASCDGLTGLAVPELLGEPLSRDHPSFGDTKPNATLWRQPGGGVVSVIEHTSLTPDVDVKSLYLLSPRGASTGSLDAFAGTIAHDFKNVLQGVASIAALLKLEAGTNLAFDPLIAALEQAVDHGVRLATRVMNGDVETDVTAAGSDAVTTVRNIHQFLGQLVGPHITIRLDLAESPVRIALSGTELEQMVINLTTNASQAIDETGIIHVGIRPCARWRAWPPASSNDMQQTFAELSVADDGRGTTQHVKSRMFENRFTTNAANGSIGIGLRSVSETVSNAGGFLRVDDGPVGGTVVRAFLPLV